MGTEKVKQKGTNGLKTETYITKMLNVNNLLQKYDTVNGGFDARYVSPRPLPEGRKRKEERTFRF